MSEKPTLPMISNPPTEPHLESPTAAEPDSKKSANKLLWLTLGLQFLIIIGVSATGFYYFKSVNTLIANNQQIQNNEIAGSKQDSAKLKQAIGDLNSKLNQISDSALSEVNIELKKAMARFQGFEQSVAAINTKLTELSPRDEQQWMISQIEYFIKMAQYRINLTGDNQGAALLLDQASVVAAQLRSPEASTLLSALSQDRANIKIDGHWQPELVHAQLNALIEQVPKLSVAAYSREDFDEVAKPSTFSEVGIGKILTKLVRVQSTDNAVKPLLNQTTRKQVEQHIFMLLTEGQLNVMRQNQQGYQSSLHQLYTLVENAFSRDQKETAFFLEEIKRLQKIEVSRPSTTLSESEQALRNLVQLFEKKQS